MRYIQNKSTKKFTVDVKQHSKDQVDEIVEDLNHHFSQQKLLI